MPIKEFELFHGAVLAKLVRSDHPVTLRMIETQTQEMWAVYRINDEVDLFIKHSTTPHEAKREPGGLTWQFNFSPEQIQQISSLHRAGKQVFIVLVCAQKNIDSTMQICFLNPEHTDQVIDKGDIKTQSVRVKYLPGKKLRIINNYKTEFLVAQNAIDTWDVPGD